MSPLTKYGDIWQLVPVPLVVAIVIAIHVVLLIKNRWTMDYVAYGVLHIAFAIIVGLWSLSLISKNSL